MNVQETKENSEKAGKSMTIKKNEIKSFFFEWIMILNGECKTKLQYLEIRLKLQKKKSQGYALEMKIKTRHPKCKNGN